MIVYIVLGRYNYDGDEIKAVFDSREKAEDYIAVHWTDKNKWTEDDGMRRSYDSVHIWDEPVR